MYKISRLNRCTQIPRSSAGDPTYSEGRQSETPSHPPRGHQACQSSWNGSAAITLAVDGVGAVIGDRGAKASKAPWGPWPVRAQSARTDQLSSDVRRPSYFASCPRPAAAAPGGFRGSGRSLVPLPPFTLGVWASGLLVATLQALVWKIDLVAPLARGQVVIAVSVGEGTESRMLHGQCKYDRPRRLIGS